MDNHVEQLFEDVAQGLGCIQDNEAVLFTIARWREALEIIAGGTPVHRQPSRQQRRGADRAAWKIGAP